MILRTQTTTANINHNALDLTKKSIQDNSVLKLATLATLFYLPGSFVAVSLEYTSLRHHKLTCHIRASSE